MTEPTLTDLYGDLPAATAKLVAVCVALDGLDRVTDAVGAFDGSAYEPLHELAGELIVHIGESGGEIPGFCREIFSPAGEAS